MIVYLAGPLFSTAQRDFLDACARTWRAAGLDCFVPHEHELALGQVTARTIFDLDAGALRRANAVVAWLDGDAVDDGTACEIGMFVEMMRRGEAWRKGILGLSTDIRHRRRRATDADGAVNLFVAGAIASAGRLCWSVDEVTAQLVAWKAELDTAP